MRWGKIMLLVIDNIDSFVYNLARYFAEIGCDYIVKRNNEITLEDIKHLNPSHIIISPGPCDPDYAGISLNVIRELGEQFPILGVCLGHQAIGQAFGGKVIKAKKPMHGKSSVITHHEKTMFKNIPQGLTVGRYHSLVVDRDSFPESLTVTATTEDGEIMALEHKELPIFGVQFHPESILTHHGHEILHNFIKRGADYG